MNELLERAEKYAAAYDGDDRQDIKTDVLNAFYAGVKFERLACASICEEKAKKCADKADEQDFEDDCIELKALAWQFSVLADEIKARSNDKLTGAGTASKRSGVE